VRERLRLPTAGRRAYTPPMADQLFGYHAGARALICPDPSGQRLVAYPVADLRSAGWTVTEEGLRASLPLLDTPQIVGADNRPLQRGLNGAVLGRRGALGLRRA